MKATELLEFLLILLFTLTKQTILLTKLSALPGSSLTTDLLPDALAMIHIQLSGVVQTSHYSALATA